MAQPFPAHMSVSVEEMRAIANAAARLYTQTARLLEASGHGLADDLRPEVSGNVVEVDFSSRRRLGVSR